MVKQLLEFPPLISLITILQTVKSDSKDTLLTKSQQQETVSYK